MFFNAMHPWIQINIFTTINKYSDDLNYKYSMFPFN